MSNWLTVINTAHRRQRRSVWQDVLWLIVYTVVGSFVAVAFIEGIW